MDDYYDFAPMLHLPRPIALGGLLSADARHLGHRLSAVTGLPFHDVDRVVEHRAGCSLWELVLRQGPDAYRALETKVLDVVLRDSPPGVIALGDGTLLNEGNRRRVLADARLIALSRDAASCYWRVRELVAAEPQGVPPNAWHPLDWSPLTSIEQLRPYVAERLPTLVDAHDVISLNERRTLSALDELRDLLVN